MRTANRLTGVVVGGASVLLGVLGIAVSLPTGFLGPAVPVLGVLSANPLLGLIQVVVGAILVSAALGGQRASRAANAWVGAFLLALGIAGLFLVGAEVNPIAATATVNAAHFGASALLLLVGLGADRDQPGPPS
jgi:hypothetical protein